MIPMWIFTGLGAFLLAACAAFFSITGLAALYAAAFIPVVIMASAVEYGKVATTFWLHRNYKKANKLWVTFLTVCVLGAMVVTSGGVYGFLTKGHIEQETPIESTNLKIERIDGKIQAQQNIINRAQQRIDQLDGVIQTLIDFDKISGKTGANAVRESQTVERKEMQDAIDRAYADIDTLMEQRLPLKQSNAAVEAKLGPIKYLAALFNVDTEKSVQWFTLLIVILLDPFAIMMVIATSHNYDEWVAARKKRKDEEHDAPKETVVIEKEVHVQDDRRIKELEDELRISRTETPKETRIKISNLEVENNGLKKQLEEALNREPVIVEKEVVKVVPEVVKNETPLTMETLSDFLNNKEIQDELVKNPDLIKEVEKIMDEAKSKEEEKKPVGWITNDGSPMEFSHNDDK